MRAPKSFGTRTRGRDSGSTRSSWCHISSICVGVARSRRGTRAGLRGKRRRDLLVHLNVHLALGAGIVIVVTEALTNRVRDALSVVEIEIPLAPRLTISPAVLFGKMVLRTVVRLGLLRCLK